MKLQVLQEKLSKALSTTSRFASAKAQLPVLGNVLLKTKKNKLLVCATNLEISIAVNVGAQITTDGEITAPSRLISDLVSNLPKKTIEISVEKERINLSTENFSSSVASMNASDFPQVPMTVDKNSITLPTESVIESLSKVLFAVSVDESRPAITGVLFIFSQGSLEMVATDGFRLSQKKLKLKEIRKSAKFILPRNVLSELTRLSNESENILFSFKKEENQAVFGLDGVVLASRIIEGEFPPYEKIIPKSSTCLINIDREEFLQAVKLASVFARDSANVVRLTVGKKGIEVKSDSKTSGEQKTFVDAKVEGEIEKFQIAFNYRFLEDFLGSVEGDSVDIKLNGGNAPGVFLDPKDKDYLHLIMPVKIED